MFLRWLDTVLRAFSGNSRDGACFKLDQGGGGGVMNSSIAPIGIARPMILAIVTSREIYPGNFKWFHRAKLFRGFKR